MKNGLLIFGVATLVLIIVAVTLVTIEMKAPTNEKCTVTINVVEDPASYQYPFDNVSTCCTIFSFTSPLTTYSSAATENQSSGNIVTRTGATIGISAYNGGEWNVTVCTYTG